MKKIALIGMCIIALLVIMVSASAELTTMKTEVEAFLKQNIIEEIEKGDADSAKAWFKGNEFGDDNAFALFARSLEKGAKTFSIEGTLNFKIQEETKLSVRNKPTLATQVSWYITQGSENVEIVDGATKTVSHGNEAILKGLKAGTYTVSVYAYIAKAPSKTEPTNYISKDTKDGKISEEKEGVLIPPEQEKKRSGWLKLLWLIILPVLFFGGRGKYGKEERLYKRLFKRRDSGDLSEEDKEVVDITGKIEDADFEVIDEEETSRHGPLPKTDIPESLQKLEGIRPYDNSKPLETLDEAEAQQLINFLESTTPPTPSDKVEIKIDNEGKIIWLQLSAGLKGINTRNLPTSLQELDLSNNQLTSIDATQLPTSLQGLYLSHNQLTSIDLRKAEYITQLDIKPNPLKQIIVNKGFKKEDLPEWEFPDNWEDIIADGYGKRAKS